jgi:hypothetical protein
MPETFLKWNKDHSISYLNQILNHPIDLEHARRVTEVYAPKQRHSAGSVSLRICCHGNSWLRSVKPAPSRRKGASSDADQQGMVSSAVYSGESRVLFVAWGDR